MRADLLDHQILNCALELFRERGYNSVDLAEIAHQADCTLDQLYTRYPRKESFVMGLFERTVEYVRTESTNAPNSTVADRFQFLMSRLLVSLQPNRQLLRQLMPAMLNPDNRLGVLGPATDRIRVEVRGIYRLIVLGSTDAPIPEQVEPLVELLYFTHLGLIFLFLQDQRDDEEFMRNNLELSADLIRIAQKTILRSGHNWLTVKLAELAGFPNPADLTQRIERLVQGYMHPPHDSAHFTQAENILRQLFRFRRLQEGAGKCQADPCSQCLALHLPRVQWALEQQRPIELVLPAFPAKSANLKKVTGPLPDLGEELALRFLQDRCDQIARLYEPGAQLTICSDGRVFSDLVGVRDEDVTAYRLALIETLDRLQLKSIQVFDLDDVRPDNDYTAMRQWLMTEYGEPLDDLKARTEEHEHHQQIFNGIHRFLAEDLAERQPELSRTQARNQSKQMAYEVIRRSNAWSKLVGEFFGTALRLSIHPQAAHSDKIGILLGDADDLWLTPWHGVALLQADRFTLTRRATAEEIGAQLISRDGRPSHYELPVRHAAASNSGAGRTT